MVIPLTLLVFYVHLIYIKEQSVFRKILLFLTIIVLLFALLLTKGIQATFVLTILFFAGLSWQPKKLKRLLIQNILLVLGFALIAFFVFYYNSNAKFWLMSYFDKRIIATFNQVGATTNNHFEIILRYLMELIPLLLLMFFLMIYFKVRMKYPFLIFLKNSRNNRVAWWLVFISLSGAIPLALTLEQRGFYIAPSIPFIVLAFVFTCKRYFFVFFVRLRRKKTLLSIFTCSLMIVSILFFILFKNDCKRDEDMLKDVSLIKKVVPYGETIGFDKSMWNMFSLRSYLNKANNNDCLVSDTTLFFVLNKDNKILPPNGYKKLNYKTYWLDIYYKKNK
jgi:hypothetical protein